MIIRELFSLDREIDLSKMFYHFLPVAMHVLEINKLPKIQLEKYIEDEEQPTFGRYVNDKVIIQLSLADRHPVDILRTLAHELVHFKQHMQGLLGPNSGETGSPEENQAHEVAGVIMRHFNKKYPMYLKSKPLITAKVDPTYNVNERSNDILPRKLVIFDIDDTLVHTQTKVHVIKDGQTIKSLNSHEFTHYKLKPGEEFDFGDFRNAREFFANAKPIIPMIKQLKHDIATGNKVVMVTARADFNDRELFLDTFRKYGIDMSKVHVYRAGNMTIKAATEEKKKIIIRNLLDKEHYTKAIMYDDAVPNLEAFTSLKKEYPQTKFYAWHVSLDGEASEYHRTNENFADGRNPQDKGDSKRHGVPTKASVSTLRKVAKQGGRKGQLAHWMANMKSGRKK